MFGINPVYQTYTLFAALQELSCYSETTESAMRKSRKDFFQSRNDPLVHSCALLDFLGESGNYFLVLRPSPGY